MIRAFEFEVWQRLVRDYEVVLPSIVVRNEAQYYSERSGGIPVELNLPSLVTQRIIAEETASPEEMSRLYAEFDRAFLPELHAGEMEALALMRENRVPEAFFCTADAAAIKAVAMLGMADRGISMETLLARIGLTKPLPKWFREDYFRAKIRAGQANRITGAGLVQGYSL